MQGYVSPTPLGIERITGGNMNRFWLWLKHCIWYRTQCNVMFISGDNRNYCLRNMWHYGMHRDIFCNAWYGNIRSKGSMEDLLDALTQESLHTSEGDKENS